MDDPKNGLGRAGNYQQADHRAPCMEKGPRFLGGLSVELPGIEPYTADSAGKSHFQESQRETIPVTFPFLPDKTGN